MFTVGMSDTAMFIFSLLTFVVAIPSAIKVFNWVATLYKGSIYTEPPLLFALAFIFLFSIGGFTGLMQGALSVNMHIHDTSFVVAHFHYVMFGGTGFGIFAAMHYWWPKMFGRKYKIKTAKVAFWFLFIGFNTLYFPMFVMGWLGMPRRYYDYLPEYTPYHRLSTIGSWILVTGLIIMFSNLYSALRKGEKTTEENIWGGESLEWKTATPPPLENFEELPEVTEAPYEYSFNEITEKSKIEEAV